MEKKIPKSKRRVGSGGGRSLQQSPEACAERGMIAAPSSLLKKRLREVPQSVERPDARG